MSAQPQLLQTTECNRVTLDIERWLSGDLAVNLAPDMYVGDPNDNRWVNGHSSPAYYVKEDERATFDLAINKLDARADNLFDLGVGGEQAVKEVGLRLAEKIGAKNYFGFDLATTLANNAAELAERTHGLNATPVICDIFERLPIRKHNTLVALLGLTLGNIETYDNSEVIKNRLQEIFAYYSHAVTSPYSRMHAQPKLGHLLVSYDANRNTREIKDCYLNPEMGVLIRSCVDRAIDTSGFDYDVVLRETPEILFLATGLRAKRDQIVPFNGKNFLIKKDKFLPVLNSSRFSIPFVTEAAAQAGWTPRNIWSATGRVQYQHFTIR